jgi:aspartate aminotransferase-like enzyme
LETAVPGLLPDVDPEGLLEYSVVFTDRALNHMSRAFQGVMKDISATLREVYRARAAVVVPGSGTFGMEAVARQFATGRRCLVVRNGWFSYRWTQIFDMGAIPAASTVLKARPIGNERHAPYAPPPVDEVVAAIRAERPEMVFAPHVETASGMILPDAYVRAVAEATHAAGGLFVLDCIASGALWVDMAASGVDVLISAPQKGWSSVPCCALVMLSERARSAIESTTSTSYACDLRKWLQIIEAYENGGHAYHATMPTDGLVRLRAAMKETADWGFERARSAQQELGDRVRALLAGKGVRSVAAPGFEAPGVVVSYTDDPEVQSGRKFLAEGLQAAAGVPLQCDEPAGFQTFRLGLFGLDKLKNIDRTVETLGRAVSRIF